MKFEKHMRPLSNFIPANKQHKVKVTKQASDKIADGCKVFLYDTAKPNERLRDLARVRHKAEKDH